MPDAVETAGQRTHKDLATPDRGVVAIAGTVECKAQHPRLPSTAFGQHARDVRAVVLHANLPSRKRPRKLGAAISGMQVVHDRQLLGPDFVHGAKVANRRNKSVAGRKVVEVADMLTRKRLTVDDQR